MTTCNFDQIMIIEFVTGEITSERRKEVEEHISTCALCRSEVAELKSTRVKMQAWSSPDPQLQWVFVPQKLPVLRRVLEWLRMPRFEVPNWAAATVAAGFIMLVAASIVNTTISVTSDGFHFSTGLINRSVSSEGDLARTVDTDGTVSGEKDIRLQEEMLRTVSSIIESRDARLRAEYQNLLTDVVKHFNYQRIEDVEKISNAVSEYQNLSDYRLRQTNTLLEGLVKVSQTGR